MRSIVLVERRTLKFLHPFNFRFWPQIPIAVAKHGQNVRSPAFTVINLIPYAVQSQRGHPALFPTKKQKTKKRMKKNERNTVKGKASLLYEGMKVNLTMVL